MIHKFHVSLLNHLFLFICILLPIFLVSSCDSLMGDSDKENTQNKSLPVPEGLTPLPNTQTELTKPTFTWKNVDTAEFYEFQIAGSMQELDSAEIISVEKVLYNSFTNYIPEKGIKNNHNHYWRVRSANGPKARSEWSQAQELKVFWGTVDGLSPLDGHNSFETKPLFSWNNSVRNPLYYQLQFAKSVEGLNLAETTLVDARKYSSQTNYSPPKGFENYQTFYWRVRAVDNENQFTPWSDTISFSIDWGKMEGLRPLNGEVFTTLTPSISWNSVKNADHFEVVIDTLETIGNHFDTILVDTRFSNTIQYIFTEPLDNLRKYFWKVRAIDEDGQATHWSATQNFELNWGELENLSPADQTVYTGTTPQLGWARNYEADHYDLRIATNENDLSSSEIILLDVHFTAEEKLSGHIETGNHYWQVRSVHANGQKGSWSPVKSFVVN